MLGMVGNGRRSVRALGVWSLVAGAAAVALVAPTGSGSSPVEAQELEPAAQVGEGGATGPASKFVPITPTRILDSRYEREQPRLFGQTSLSIDPTDGTGVAEAAGVAADEITAVVLNTTMVGADGTGFATMWPTGSPRPDTATNNSRFVGQNIGNLVIAPIGVDGKISFFSSTATNVTLDVLGVFTRSDASDDGRFVAIEPVRQTDTRDAGGRAMRARETRTFDLASVGVPRSATGVVMNMTAINANGRGFYTVWPAGDPQPDTANVNVLGRGYTAGNQVVSGMNDGRIQVYTDIGSDLTIDVTGYFTGDGGGASVDGLFVPIEPSRFLDTRRDDSTIGLNGGDPLPAGRRFTLDVTGAGGVPQVGVKALALNLTGFKAAGRGFVKAFPSGSTPPDTSSLNFTQSNQTVPNHAITAIDVASGSIDLLPDVAVDMIVDGTGYFLDERGVLPDGVDRRTTVDPGDFVPTPLGAAPQNGPYDFIFDRSAYRSTGRRPNPTMDLRFATCEPIRYALNVDLANDAQVVDMITAIENVERATGADFRFAGVTSAGMNIDEKILLAERFDLPHRYLPPGADVVIGYSNERDTPELAGNVLGIGGGIGLRSGEIIRGFATFDADDLNTSARRVSSITHELGHMMGLGHVSDFDPRTERFSTAFQGLDPNAGNWSTSVLRDQLMYPYLLSPPLQDFAYGDKRGLWELYGDRPCLSTDALTDPDADTGPARRAEPEPDVSGAVLVVEE